MTRLFRTTYGNDRRKHRHRCRACGRILTPMDAVTMWTMPKRPNRPHYAIHTACEDRSHDCGTWRDALEAWTGLKLPDRPKQRLVTVPATYARDAIERGLDVGEPIGWRPRAMVLRCTAAQLEELLSDCEYYADPAGGPNAESARHVVNSARRALPTIREAVEQIRR